MNDANGRRYVAAAVGTNVFAVVVPGTAVAAVPYGLMGWPRQALFIGLRAPQWLGVFLFLVAAPTLRDFFVRFVRRGSGPPAPIAPPRHLVTSGPGHTPTVAMVAAQELWFGSRVVLAYGAGLAIAFHPFAVFVEEPGMGARFGAADEQHGREVPRWIPRMRACGGSRNANSRGR